MIPLSKPDITELEIKAVVDVLRSSRLSLGPELEAFEAETAAYVGALYAVGVSSGTAGLHLALLALGIGRGDEVIVPSFTFIAAANAIRYVGATPVFVDIDADTLNMDPAQVEAAVSPHTRALMIVHTFGLPADLDALLAIAQRHRLFVVEDACEALGARYRGQRVGSFGHLAVFAFYPNKQITTGEGGMVVTPDPALARQIRALRNQGRYDSDDWFQHTILGYNYRLSEMQCALGRVQLSRLDEILQRRDKVATLYRSKLRCLKNVKLPPEPPAWMRLSWFVFVIQYIGECLANRDLIVQHLQEQGVQCGRYFAPVHLQPAYASEWGALHLPVTEAVSRRTIALPFFTALTEPEIDTVVTALGRALGSSPS